MKKIFPLILFIITCGFSYLLAKALKHAQKQNKTSLKKQRENPFIKRKIRTIQYENQAWYQFFRQKPAVCFLIAAAFFSYLTSDFMKNYSHLFKASLLNLPKTEFTGTVSPVEKVPDWTKLTNSERKANFSQIPASKLIPLPEYNPDNFKKGQTENATDAERNAYITYPVPNLGNYQLDGTENSGSHPGVDIKIPVGTPIRAIANGVVYKTGYQETGYGNYISIAHSNVPDPDNPTEKITIVSNYAHLSSISVKDGEIVTKGQIIGKSGESGMVTAPHIHFQIDRENAPFHPYWPFTWSEISNAGITSYFEAVKVGFGKTNAQKYTVHSINLVTKYEEYNNANLVVEDTQTSKTLSDQTTVVENNDSNTNTSEDDTLNSSAPKPVDPDSVELVEQTPEKTQTNTTTSEEFKLVFETDRGFIPGKDEVVTVYVNQEALVASNGTINLSSTLKNKTTITPPKLTKNDFVNGSAEIKVNTASESSFKLIAQGDFEEVKSKSLRPEIFTDVPNNHLYADAIKYLKKNNIVSGYADNTFKPDNSLNRAEALKIILIANNFVIQEKNTDFPDVPRNSWFEKYVATAVSQNIVSGYADGKFRPDNLVNRAEFLKMSILSAGFDPTETNSTYPDVSADQWYSRFFAFAQEHSLLKMKKGGFIVPNDAITRAEAADVIYRLSLIEK